MSDMTRAHLACPSPHPPSALPAPALRNRWRRRDQLHLGGAAPRFALGVILFVNHSLGVFLYIASGHRSPVVVGPFGGLLRASWNFLGAS